jgi:hypothetical protein
MDKSKTPGEINRDRRRFPSQAVEVAALVRED